jgi:caa(3)-type oxidase subunit IV
MSSTTSSTKHGMVFSALVAMALSSVGIVFLHLPGFTQNIAVFSVAFLMAGLVFFQYMDLKSEGKLIYWIMVIPFVLFGILVVLFIPDVCHYSIDFMKGL